MKRDINKVIKKYYNKIPLDQLAQMIGLTYEQTRWKARMMGLTKGTRKKLVMDVNEKLLERQAKREEKLKDTQLLSALTEIEVLRKKLKVVQSIKEPVNSFEIKAMEGRGGEATIVALASDWHIEERVEKANVNGLNFYNLEESKRRATKYFQVLLRLIQIEQNETKVDRLVLALLGDFISSDIHVDIAKSCLLEPTHAIQRCKEYLISGIDFLLKNSELKITIVCHTGNHGRKDKEQMIANEAGNSLEWLMYQNLQDIYRNEPRLTFVIPEGYHSYVTVYDTVLRFHHGHSIRYGGGVGGLTVPANKAIAQWNRAKKADIDCFGHFHQIFDGGNFIVNGSMIGFSPYAISIKAAYERPAQMFFGVHSKLGKYVTRPIYFI